MIYIVTMSGDYTCRVATFTHEERMSHTMTVFGKQNTCIFLISCSSVPDPGVGPLLRYSEVNNQVNLSCHVEEVFPEPQLDLEWDYGLTGGGNRSWDKYR